jgi:hypothetical protein
MELESYDAEGNENFANAKIFVTNNNQRCEYNYLRAVREARDKNVPLIIWYNELVQPNDLEYLGKLNHYFLNTNFKNKIK